MPGYYFGYFCQILDDILTLSTRNRTRELLVVAAGVEIVDLYDIISKNSGLILIWATFGTQICKRLQRMPRKLS